MLNNAVQTLIDNFREQIDSYQNAVYNETQLRRDFLDKVIKILGWDVDNEKGFAESFREVIHEDRLKIAGRVKAPDYCIQAAGRRLFYIEAKKPSVNIHDDAAPAFQIRRYGWNAKMPVCLLSDFYEFAVYDTSVKPNNTDDAARARVFYCRYDELEKHNPKYPDAETNWDFLYNLFSKDAVYKGSLDKFKSSDKKKGTQAVDDSFLEDIESWRVALASNITLRNKITERELNFAIGLIIDRVIFLRICEDRGIEDQNALKIISDKKEIYKALIKHFEDADEKYNSGLFHFRQEKEIEDEPDTLTPKLSVDDKVLKEIIKSLYYPAPYEFSVMDTDILGSIYERFLGKIIRMTSAHRAKVEEKPEVRKAGGVYYTPQYIVDYIVKHTIGAKLEGATPKTLGAFHVVDPACGSGSFLINAYQYLLDWYLREYIKAPADYKKRLLKTGDNDYKLTIQERKRILTTHIYGVDIDAQAVEVTKLSLLLKAVEGLSEQEIQKNLFKERVLPNLSGNIKCGNSLIGSDFYVQGTLGLSEDEQYKINVFDWEYEFAGIFKDGGFDVVVGNPPYTYMISDEVQNYFQKTYKYQDYQKDLYLIFLEKYSLLLKQGGTFGVIVSNTWLLSITYRKIRQYLTSNYRWRKILHLPEKVFSEAVVDTHVLIFDRAIPTEKDRFDVEVCHVKTASLLHSIDFSSIPKDGSPINITVNSQSRILFEKIVKKCKPLENYCNIYNGVKPFEKGKGSHPQTERVMKEKPYVFEGKQPADEWSPLLRGSLIHRYVNRWNNDYWIKYGQWLAAPRDPAIFENPEKIVIRQTGDSLIATYIGKGIICRDNLHIIINNCELNLLCFLAIINSRLLDFIYQIINPEKGEAFAQVKKSHVEQLPMPALDLSKKSDKAKHDKLTALSGQMLDLKKREHSATVPQTKTMLGRQIAALDKQIDETVYALYGLSEDEINIVENK